LTSDERTKHYQATFGEDNRSLMMFLENLREFDQTFCDVMFGRKDFTIRLEVRGNQGSMIHCRVMRETFDRPSGIERTIEQKRRRIGGRK
jgi:hypothetical protein